MTDLSWSVMVAGMTDYDAAFAPPSQADRDAATRTATVQRVQASLYQRLRPHYPAPSARGVIGWLLIRLAQDGSPKHDESRAALLRRSIDELRVLSSVATGAVRGAASDEWRKLATAIVDALEALIQSKERALMSDAEIVAGRLRVGPSDVTDAEYVRRVRASGGVV